MSIAQYYIGHDSKGNQVPVLYNTLTPATTPQCYQATCSIDSVVGNLPDGEVSNGGAATVYATIYNNSEDQGAVNNMLAIPSTDPSGAATASASDVSPNDLILQSNLGNTGPLGGVPSYGSIPVSFPITAPASGTTGSISAGVSFDGDYFLSDNANPCTGSFSIYQAPTPTINAACDTAITGSASDPYEPGDIWVVLYADGTASGNALNSGNPILADGPGGTYSFNMPASLQDGQNHTLYVVALDPFGMLNSAPLEYNAPTGMTGCESFHLQPGANGGKLSPAAEAPTSFAGSASVIVGYGPKKNAWYGPNLDGTSNKNLFPSFPGVPASVTYTLTKNGGAALASGSVPSNPNPPGNGPFNGTTTYTPPAVTITPLTYVAGDTYCINVSANPIDGFIQNDGVILSVTGSPPTSGHGPDTQSSCDKVVNEPFFKADNSSVSTGSSFAPAGPGSCTGGELASWNNDTGTNPSSGDFGAGAQLGALAAMGITGFASNQKAPPTLNAPPTNLSFANTVPGDISSDIASPKLGGNFGNSGSCLPPSAASPTSVVKAGSTASISALATGAGQQSYSYGTSASPVNLTLSSGTVPVGDNVSVYVKGNVYISGGGIVYAGDPPSGPGGRSVTWSSAADVPSFALYATGNIYVDPGVTELDGLYTAQPASGGTGGKVYTCSAGTATYPDGTTPATPFAFMAASELYANCKKQLVVYGNFVANQVNLMRAFGSLRDETPIGGSAGGSQLGLVWSCGGSICNPSTSGLSCTSMNVTAAPDSQTWFDNKLCAPASVQLNWNLSTSPSTLAGAKAASGLPFCTPWNVNLAGEGSYWSNNWLCSNKDLTFSYTGQIAGKYCTYINEPSDLVASDLWNSNKTYLCEPLAASAAPATAGVVSPCSNGAAPLLGTCASEVFDFSPELYLPNWSVTPPSNGALQYKAVTGLPPVL